MHPKDFVTQRDSWRTTELPRDYASTIAILMGFALTTVSERGSDSMIVSARVFASTTVSAKGST